MRYVAVLLCMFVPMKGLSSPLITSSEQTYQRLCLEFEQNYERMVTLCSKALTESGASLSQRIKLLDNLGSSYLGLERYDAAERTFKRLLALRRNHHDGWSGLGWVHWNQGSYEDALDAFEQSILSRPTASAIAGKAASLEELRRAGFTLTTKNLAPP